jgi:hypothetical protein
MREPQPPAVGAHEPDGEGLAVPAGAVLDRGELPAVAERHHRRAADRDAVEPEAAVGRGARDLAIAPLAGVARGDLDVGQRRAVLVGDDAVQRARFRQLEVHRAVAGAPVLRAALPPRRGRDDLEPLVGRHADRREHERAVGARAHALHDVAGDARVHRRAVDRVAEHADHAAARRHAAAGSGLTHRALRLAPRFTDPSREPARAAARRRGAFPRPVGRS